MRIEDRCYFDLEQYSSLFVELSDSNPRISTDGYLTKLMPRTSRKSRPKVENSICICDLACDYKELVFSEAGAIVTEWKNDKTSLLFTKQTTTDTIVIKLIASDLTEYTITDDTYGTYYSTFTAASLQVGFVCDWNKVYNSLGRDTYYFEITKTIFGDVETIESVKYSLELYSDERADGTVRIESWQTGNMLNKEIVYKDLINGGWYNSTRIKGRLLNKKPTTVLDNYYNQDNRLEQIQDKIENEYILETELIPISISDMLIEDNLMANVVKISDFNVFSEQQLKEIELSLLEVDKTSFSHNRNSIFKITMKDKIDEIIKYNY